MDPNPIIMSNGDHMMPASKGEIKYLPNINPDFKTAQACPDNVNATLISLGKSCNNDCLALTDKHKIIVCKDEKQIIKASRCNKTGMPLVNLSNPAQLVNVATVTKASRIVQIHNFTSKSRLLFMHASLGGPSISTLLKAIRVGCLTAWPDLIEENVSKLSTPDCTMLGHLDQKRKNSQSTRAVHEASD